MVTMATMNSAVLVLLHRLSHSTTSPSLPKSSLIPTNSLPSLRSSRWAPRCRLSSTSANQTDAVAAAVDGAAEVDSASEIVRTFYGGINGRDLPSVEGLISLDCVYEDLIFPRPFVGREEILEFFGNFIDIVGKDLQFVIDKISTEDSSSVGVTWHLEWKGKPFPFSKGCSFYQLEIIDGKRQIVYARDSVEPAIKPGKSALAIIRGVTWLLRQFPQLVDRF